jgi:two-component system, cell cycle sensor histidine kinase and response regulator CckA
MSTVKTVLVVDDEPSVLRVASKVLRRDGYEILEALGGEEALRIAAEHDGGIDLLLTDVVMPGLGGRELGERFRDLHPATALLFMSGYTEDEVLLQGIRVAEVNYISKPFTVAGLRDKVRQILNGPSDA